MKKTFIFYNDWEDYTDEMSLEEKWLFLQTILNYQNWRELWNIDKIKFIWSRVKKQLDENNQARDIEIEHRKEAWRKWWLAKASKTKQVLASASKSKQIVADNVNVNVNDNIINKEIDTKVSMEQVPVFWNWDINNLISELKKLSNELWVAYDGKDERKFWKHICTAKQFWEFCEKIWQDRITFAKNVMIVSIKINFWKWPCAWPMKIYQNYSEVYNLAKSTNKKEWEKKGWVWVLSSIYDNNGWN